MGSGWLSRLWLPLPLSLSGQHGGSRTQGTVLAKGKLTRTTTSHIKVGQMGPHTCNPSGAQGRESTVGLPAPLGLAVGLAQ